MKAARDCSAMSIEDSGSIPDASIGRLYFTRFQEGVPDSMDDRSCNGGRYSIERS